MNFSEKLKLLRADKNISQKKLAEQLGISYRAIQNYEANKQEPTLSIIVSFAKAFCVSTDFLLGVGVSAKFELIRKNLDSIIGQLILDLSKTTSPQKLITRFSELSEVRKICAICDIVSDIEFADSTIIIHYRIV